MQLRTFMDGLVRLYLICKFSTHSHTLLFSLVTYICFVVRGLARRDLLCRLALYHEFQVSRVLAICGNWETFLFLNLSQIGRVRQTARRTTGRTSGRMEARWYVQSRLSRWKCADVWSAICSEPVSRRRQHRRTYRPASAQQGNSTPSAAWWRTSRTCPGTSPYAFCNTCKLVHRFQDLRSEEPLKIPSSQNILPK